MTTQSNPLRHFETVWEAAERLAHISHANTSTVDLVSHLKAEADSLFTYDALPADVRKLMRQRAIGSVLFLLCAITDRENINAWQALTEETKAAEAESQAPTI